MRYLANTERVAMQGGDGTNPKEHLLSSRSRRGSKSRTTNRSKIMLAILPTLLSFALGAGVAIYKSKRDREILEVKKTQVFSSLIDHLLSKDCNRRKIAFTLATQIDEVLAAKVGGVLSANDPCPAVQQAAKDGLRKIAQRSQTEAGQMASKELARQALAGELTVPTVRRNLEAAKNYRGLRTPYGEEQALKIYTEIFTKLSPAAQNELRSALDRNGWKNAKGFDTESVPYFAAAFSESAASN